MSLLGASRRALRVLCLGAGLAFAGNACLGQTCTLVGCSDGAYIDVGREGAWREGSYTLEFSIDGEPHSCDFVVPDALPSRGQATLLDCGEGSEVELWQSLTCTSVVSHDGNSGSGSCTPIADEYQLSLELQGNPKTVSISLSRDGQPLLSDSRDPKYEPSYPNGPDCGEGCRQGGYDLIFED